MIVSEWLMVLIARSIDMSRSGSHDYSLMVKLANPYMQVTWLFLDLPLQGALRT